MRYFVLNSIKARLNLLIILLSILPVLLIGSIIAWQSFQEEKTESIANQRQSAIHVAIEIKNMIDTHVSQLELLATTRDVHTLSTDDQYRLLSGLFAGDHAYSEIRLLDANGMEVIRLSRLRVVAPSELTNRAGTAEFGTPRSTRETYFSPVWFDAKTGNPYLTVAIPLIELSGNTVDGVLAVDLDIRAMWRLMTEAHLPPFEQTYIIDDHGRVIAHRNPALVLRGVTVQWPRDVSTLQTGLNGTKVLRAVEPVTFGRQKLGVVVEDTLWNGVHLGILSFFLTFGVIAFTMLVGMYISRHVIQSVVAPMEELVTTAQRITAGNYFLQAAVPPDAPAELQALGTAFNQTTSSLVRSLEQLENMVAELEESQAALSESEERYRALFENANDSIFIADPDTHRFIEVNENAARRLGYTRSELLRMTFEDLNHGGAFEENAALIEQMQHGGVQFQRVHRRKDGSLMPVEISSQLVEFGGVKVVQSIVRDISERIAAQQTLQDNLNFMETLLDTIPSPVFYKNAMGEYIGCNNAFADLILGLPKEKIIGRTILDLDPHIPPDLAEIYINHDQLVLNSPGAQFYESNVLCADGVRREFFFSKAAFTNADGDPAGIVGVMVDVSEQKQTEARLLRANRLYAVLSQVNAAVLHFEDRRELLQCICSILTDQGHFSLAWAGILNPDTFVLEPVAVSGARPDYLDAVEIVVAPDSPQKNCPGGQATQRGETVSFNYIIENPDFERWNDRATQYGYQSAAAIPIKTEHRTIGAISLYADDPDFFSVDELRLLKEIEDTLAFGLGRHHQQQIQDISYRIAEAAITLDNLSELFAAIHDSVGRLMPVRNFYIALYDEETDMLTFPYFVDAMEIEPPPPAKLGKGLTEYVLRTGKPLLASGNDFDTLIERDEIEPRGPSARDWAGVPLKIAERTIGVLAVQSYTERNRYGEEELNILQFVSNQIALAIDRVRITNALRRQVAFNRRIYDTIQDGYLLFNAAGTILDVNNAYCAMLGFTPDELLGASMMDVLSVYKPEDVRFHIDAILRGERTRISNTQRRKDGTLAYFDISLAVIESDDEPLVAAFYRDVTEQREMLRLLEYRHKFEERVTTISTRFANCPIVDTDAAITESLADIGQFVHADRSYVYLFTDDGAIMNKTHEWCAEGIESQLAAMQNVRSADYPWWMGFLEKGDIIHIPNVEELPPEAENIRQMLIAHHVQSLVVVPMIFAGKLVGFMGLDDVRTRRVWAEEDIILLETVGDVMVNAIQRRRNDARIRQRNRELALLNKVIAAGIAATTPEEIFKVVCDELHRTFSTAQVVGGVLNDDFSELEIVADTEPNPCNTFIGRIFYPRENPLVKELLEHDHTFVLHNPAEFSIMGEARQDFERRHIKGLVMLPVAFGGKLFGGITLFYFEPLPLTPDEISLAQQVADQVGAVLARFQLSWQHSRLITAIEQAGESIFITDINGRIIYVNPFFEKSTGYSQEEVLGKTSRILNSGQQTQEFYAEMWTTILGGNIWQGRIVNRRKDGELITEEMVISPVRNLAGDVVNFVAVKRDITDALKLEEQYRQSQKMEAIGQLSGGIAHDFNNLLTAINGYADMLVRQAKPGSDEREMAQNILGAGNRAAELTRQLLAFSRKTLIRPQLMDVNETVNNLAKMLRRIIGDDILLKFNVADDLHLVKMDPSQMEQIILNLVVNARDAMPLGGEVTISTENSHFATDEVSPFSGLAPGYYVRLSVTDTGMGMPPEILEHIFEPFFTTKEVGKGTGLGLATVFGVVKQNGGDIRVYSEVGEGTTFTVYLPAELADDAQTSAPESLPDNTVPTGTEVILVVDDDADVRFMTVMALEDQGYQVYEAEGAAEALAWLSSTEVMPALLITDVIMPETSGKTLVAQAQELKPDLKVIYMSGYPEDQISRHQILDARINFLQKPFLPTDLARLVRRVLDEN